MRLHVVCYYNENETADAGFNPAVNARLQLNALTCSSCSIWASCAALLAASRGVMGRWR